MTTQPGVRGRRERAGPTRVAAADRTTFVNDLMATGSTWLRKQRPCAPETASSRCGRMVLAWIKRVGSGVGDKKQLLGRLVVDRGSPDEAIRAVFGSLFGPHFVFR